MIGTPGYMAPEQVRGETALDARTDVFSLGCVLYRSLTGAAAFGGDQSLAVLAKILVEDVVKPSEIVPDVPPALDAIVLRMIAKDREARFADDHGLRDPVALAEHFSRGGERDRAAQYWRLAAEHALAGNDNATALAHVQRGLDAGATGDLAGELYLVRAEAHNWRGELAREGRQRRHPRARVDLFTHVIVERTASPESSRAKTPRHRVRNLDRSRVCDPSDLGVLASWRPRALTSIARSASRCATTIAQLSERGVLAVMSDAEPAYASQSSDLGG